LVGIVQPKADPWCCLHFTKYKFNVYRKKYIRSGRDSAVVGIVGKSKSLDFLKMLIFWSLVRNSVVLAVYLLFSVACFFTVHEHCLQVCDKWFMVLSGAMRASRPTDEPNEPTNKIAAAVGE